MINIEISRNAKPKILDFDNIHIIWESVTIAVYAIMLIGNISTEAKRKEKIIDKIVVYVLSLRESLYSFLSS